MDKKILKIELVPDGCWYSNLRAVLSAKEWNYIKAKAKERAGGKCAICGKKTNYLDAHEQWSYDEKKGVQKLIGIIAVCKDCHSVIHIGRTSLVGNIEKAENHYLKVNGATYAEYRAALKKANEEHRRRNEVSEWSLDISYLKDYLDEGDTSGNH